MNGKALCLSAAAMAMLLGSIGCGSGAIASNFTNPISAAQSGTVNVMLSDDATQDWATIAVRVVSLALTPQGGGAAVSVYTAPSTPPFINLVQLDQLSEIIGNATVPAGTYTSATLTLAASNSGSSCDIELIASADPETGFDVPAGTSVPCSQIVIAGATANQTVPLNITLKTPLTVTSNSSNALDLEFNLQDPALIVEHKPAGAASPAWVVNFNGPVRHHPRPDMAKILLRHTYGQVTTISDSTMTIAKAFPVRPITSPETATVVTTDTLPILADATNGTLYFDLDSGDTPTTITDFSSLLTTLPSMFVRVAARYQNDGSLTATRIYASTSFDKIWQNPEGHVLHVNTSNDTMWVTTEDGGARHIAIAANTSFYFQSSNSVIGTGTGFFTSVTAGNLPNLARGFKVNVTADPLSTTTPVTALSVEIDVARYDGAITSPGSTDFEYTRNFADADSTAHPARDDYRGTLPYIASTSANTDPSGTAVDGFLWWDLGFPTLADTGTNAVSDYVSATGGSANFGGLVGPLRAVGLSNSTWNDPAAPDSWAALWTILLPAPAPIGTITTAFATSTDSFTFTVPVPAAAPSTTAPATPVTVDLATTAGSATLVYQIDRQGGVITVTPQDISNSSTLTTVAGNLAVGVPVKVFGVPQIDGSIKAYTLFYYTHTASTI